MVTTAREFKMAKQALIMSSINHVTGAAHSALFDEVQRLAALRAQGPVLALVRGQHGDAPSCPDCRGYNAMIHVAAYGRDGEPDTLQCRDCGAVGVVSPLQHPC